jgi:hypothetical protein
LQLSVSFPSGPISAVVSMITGDAILAQWLHAPGSRDGAAARNVGDCSAILGRSAGAADNTE